MDFQKSLPPDAYVGGSWHVTIRHGPGSVEHFHHFLLGFLVPLIHQISTEWAEAGFKRLIVRSCGPLDHLVRELGDARIEIVDPASHRHMAEAADYDDPAAADALQTPKANLVFVTIQGCDYPATYDKRKFAMVREVLLSTDAIRSELRAEMNGWRGSGTRILLVQRGASPAFYNSERSEQKGSGKDRRSIANHDELHHSLSVDGAGCRNVMMENLSLARQIAIFSLADIIIAQHGAALANIIWARPNATVIEICPRSSVRHADFFCHLALCMGLRYRRVWQDDQHAKVDVDLIRDIVAQSIASRPSRTMSALRSAAFRILQPWIPRGRLLGSLPYRGWRKAMRLIGRL